VLLKIYRPKRDGGLEKLQNKELLSELANQGV
jgi:hypothetical protein